MPTKGGGEPPGATPAASDAEQHAEGAAADTPAAAATAAAGAPPPPPAAPSAAELRALFDSFDADRNGQLELQEVQAALQALGLPASQRYMGELLSQYDRDASRCIDFDEFRGYVEGKEKRIRAVFARIDGDGDGALDAGEVHRAARALGLSVAPEEAERMVRMLDSDGDGHINYSEFRRFCVLLPSAHISHTHIVAAWTDSTSWLECSEYRLGHVPPSQPLERFLAGGVAGAVSRTVVAPLERLRTILMTDRNATLGPTLRRMWSDGPKGLFRGNLATVIKVFPSSAIQFAMYDACKDVLLHFSPPGTADLDAGQKLTAGLVAGAVACGATYPLEMLRTQVAIAQGSGAAVSYPAIIRSMLAQRGAAGLYQGFTAGLANNSISMALGFASYEGLCIGYSKWRGESPSVSTRSMLGGAAALLVTSGTMPLENLVRRMQVQGREVGGKPAPRYASTLDCARLMLAKEGIGSFWRGTFSSFAKIGPSIAATRLLYETVVDVRGIGGVRRYRHAA